MTFLGAMLVDSKAYSAVAITVKFGSYFYFSYFTLKYFTALKIISASMANTTTNKKKSRNK